MNGLPALALFSISAEPTVSTTTINNYDLNSLISIPWQEHQRLMTWLSSAVLGSIAIGTSQKEDTSSFFNTVCKTMSFVADPLIKNFPSIPRLFPEHPPLTDEQIQNSQVIFCLVSHDAPDHMQKVQAFIEKKLPKSGIALVEGKRKKCRLANAESFDTDDYIAKTKFFRQVNRAIEYFKTPSKYPEKDEQTNRRRLSSFARSMNLPSPERYDPKILDLYVSYLTRLSESWCLKYFPVRQENLFSSVKKNLDKLKIHVIVGRYHLDPIVPQVKEHVEKLHTSLRTNKIAYSCWTVL